MKLRRAATVFLLALSAVMGTSVAHADRAAYVDAVAEEKWLEALAAYDDLDADDQRDPLIRFGRAQALGAAGLDSASDREAAAAEESRLRVFRTEPRAKSPLPLLGFVSANGSSPPDVVRSLEVLRDVARKEARTKGCRRFRGESVDDYRMHCLAFHYLDTRTHSEEAAILLEAAALKKPGTLAPWLIPAAKAPIVVSAKTVARMRPGSVIVDIAIDQGGCIESIRPTSHQNPVYEQHGVIHYAVPNMPALVGRTSTLGLTQATEPYVAMLVSKGVERALAEHQGLARGVNTENGKITYGAVAKALGFS